jgi:plastocyanin
MKRALLSMIGIVACCGIGLIASSAMAIDGPLANATVSFGEWNPNAPNLIPTNPGEVPLDRLVGDPGGGRGNNHPLIPQMTTIKAGGSVNFIISGGHVLAVYDDGHQPEEIGSATEPDCAFPLPSSGITSPCSPVNSVGGMQVAGGILSDPIGRIYRGAFLNLARRDGVEVVQFSKPGTYLVICARKNHFVNDGMFGFVRVLPNHRR